MCGKAPKGTQTFWFDPKLFLKTQNKVSINATKCKRAHQNAIERMIVHHNAIVAFSKTQTTLRFEMHLWCHNEIWQERNMNAGERDDSVYKTRRLRLQNAVVALDNATIAFFKAFTFKTLSFTNAEINAQIKRPCEIGFSVPSRENMHSDMCWQCCSRSDYTAFFRVTRHMDKSMQRNMCSLDLRIEYL